MCECPAFDLTCPYCDCNGYCHMLEKEGCMPEEECDVFFEYDEDY